MTQRSLVISKAVPGGLGVQGNSRLGEAWGKMEKDSVATCFKKLSYRKNATMGKSLEFSQKDSSAFPGQVLKIK